MCGLTGAPVCGLMGVPRVLTGAPVMGAHRRPRPCRHLLGTPWSRLGLGLLFWQHGAYVTRLVPSFTPQTNVPWDTARRARREAPLGSVPGWHAAVGSGEAEACWL